MVEEAQTHTGSYQLVASSFQRRLPAGRVQCGLCPWRCRIPHGQSGFCKAHVNRHGRLYNLSYGIVSALESGAIEDKPVRYYRPGSRILSLGGYGCNFRCKGCHNLEISWGVEALKELAQGRSKAAFLPPQKVVDLALERGLQGIAFTYSEPAIWFEYVLDTARLAQQAGLYTVCVSNGFITPLALRRLSPYLDVLCSDIKSMDDHFYSELCRAAKVEDILAMIAMAAELGVHVETRTNIIPGRNDKASGLYAIARWIHDHLGADSPWHITRFFPAYELSHLPPTPLDTMAMAGREGRRAGLQRVHVLADKSCDCAAENDALEKQTGIGADGAVQRCQQDCCGEQGILLRKFERRVASPLSQATK